jgi:thiol-disulfide isomerase/thioredoxin
MAKKTLGKIVLLVLAGLLAALTAMAEQPLTQDDITLLLLGGAQSEKVITLVEQRGLAFQLTPELEKKFKNAGASDELLDVMRRVGSKPQPAAPSAPAAPPAASAAPSPAATPPSPPQNTEEKVQHIMKGLSSAPAGSTEDLPYAPSFTVKTLSGTSFNSRDFKGKVLLVNFWATWCGPCKQEVPALTQLQDEYGNQGFQIIGISLDRTSAPVRQFVHTYRMSYPVAMGDRDLAQVFGGISAVPTTFLIGRDGRVHYKVSGALPLESLNGRVQTLLATSALSGGQLASAQPAEANGPQPLKPLDASKIPEESGGSSVAYPPETAQPAPPLPPAKPAAPSPPAVKPAASSPAAAAAKPDLSNPSPDRIQEIIRAFAAKEKLFKEARDNYTYHQINKVETLDADGNVDGMYQQEWDILYDDSGKRIERVTYAPLDTLKRIMITPQDLDAMRNIQPFVLTTDELPEYDIKYLGHVKVDEITAYVFSVRPKEIKKGHQYFQGVVWVDDRDLQIVKSEGKQVPELHTKRGENLFPRFITWRQQIDGKFWFPTFTLADDTLYFDQGPVHIKEVIRYTDYKQFKAGARIIGVEAIDQPKNKDQKKDNPTPPPPKQ